MKSVVKWTAAAVLALSLAACGNGSGENGTPEPSGEGIAQALDGDASRLGAAVETAGLTDAMEGVGPYTVFAPLDDAIPEDFAAAEGPEAAAFVRAHIAPGMMTRADIVAALDASEDRDVQMRTMDDGLLTFSRDGDTILVTAEDGAAARLTGDEELVENGAIQPVDAILVSREG